jgi:UDP-GlcNAc:undecaprenyl-phosphate GlcNAc-1-phosphate transferase
MNYIILFIFSLLAVYLSLFLGSKIKIIDNPSSEKIHKVPVPRTGGIALFVAFLASNILFSKVLSIYELGFLFFIFLIGLIDDLISVPQRLKLAIEIILSLILFIVYPFHFIGIYVLDILFAIFYLVGSINAFNIIDGMDGLAAGIAIIAFSFLYIYSGNIALLVAIICAGFLVWNFHKAKIYMGDSGSLFLGGLIGLISLRVLREHPRLNTVITLIFIYAIPIYDSALSIIRRLENRKELFKPDIEHFYNKLYRKIKNYVVTVVLIYFFAIILGFIGIGLYNAKTVVSLSTGLIVWSLMFFAGYKLGFIGGKDGKHTDVSA